ncbi:MAG: HIT domain-containing protein [Candidatus Omnitrophota bacterium]
MDRIWAPWRMSYIRAGLKQKGCLFCRLKRQKGRDRKNFVVWRGDLCLVALNLFPYNNGHLLVSPYRHISDICRLRDEETRELMQAVSRMKALLDKIVRPQGYNIGMNLGKVAGAGVAGHLHIHIVPRWQGDTNFMPVTGNTKVIAQSLGEMYGWLKSVKFGVRTP